MCLSRAAAEALLPASQHTWGSSTFQQTQYSWEGTTHHHLCFGSQFTPQHPHHRELNQTETRGY